MHGCLHCVLSNFFPRKVGGRVVASVSAAHGQSCPRIRRLHHSFSFGGVGCDFQHNSNGLGSCGPRGSLVWIRPQWQVPRESLPIAVSTLFLLFSQSHGQAIKRAIHFPSPLILHSGCHECWYPSQLSLGKNGWVPPSLSQGQNYTPSPSCTILPVSRMCMSADSERRWGYLERNNTDTGRAERARPQESDPRPSFCKGTVIITVYCSEIIKKSVNYKLS